MDYTIKLARYAKGQFAVNTPSPDGFKTRAARLADALAGGRYTHREHAYILSQSQVSRFERLYAEGWDASVFGALLDPDSTVTPTELDAVLGPRWAICRNTERNRERYGRCITQKAYRLARTEALELRK